MFNNFYNFDTAYNQYIFIYISKEKIPLNTGISFSFDC